MSDTTKKCSKCGEVKLLGEFGINRFFNDGLHIYCKPCSRFMSSRWRKENPEKARNIRIRTYKKSKKRITEYHKQWVKKNSKHLKSYFEKYHQSDAYIKSLLVRDPKIRGDISQKLIDLKREQVQLKRLLKELDDVNKNR